MKTDIVSLSVDNLMRQCLFRESELNDEVFQKAIKVQGLENTFYLNPKKIEKRKDDILELVEFVPDENFLRGKGGGATVLNLTETKYGDEWGDVKDVSLFCVLSIASNFASWKQISSNILPRNLPFIVFDKQGFSENLVNRSWD